MGGGDGEKIPNSLPLGRPQDLFRTPYRKVVRRTYSEFRTKPDADQTAFHKPLLLYSSQFSNQSGAGPRKEAHTPGQPTLDLVPSHLLDLPCLTKFGRHRSCIRQHSKKTEDQYSQYGRCQEWFDPRAQLGYELNLDDEFLQCRCLAWNLKSKRAMSSWPNGRTPLLFHILCLINGYH